MIERVKNFCKLNKKYIVMLFIVALSSVSIYIKHIDRKNTLIINENKLQSDDGKIAVYITGQVKNEGVYYLSENSRLYNLIDLSGGLLEDADMTSINLATKLKDGEKIEVPKKKVISDTDKLDEDNFENVESAYNLNTKVNINTASKQELKSLSGIGDSTATKIIEYRKNNTFDNIEDIMNVPGIGESKFESIKDYICVD